MKNEEKKKKERKMTLKMDADTKYIHAAHEFY